MSIRSFIAAIMVVTTLSACSDDLPVPVSDKPGKLALLGELTVGETFSIRGGRSAPMGSKSVPIPTSLTVTLRDGDGGAWTLAGVQDSLSEELRTVSVAAGVVISAGGRYTIAAEHPGLGPVQAVVEVPQPVAATLVDTVRGQRWGRAVLDARIQIQDGPGQHFYVIEAVRQPVQLIHEFFHDGQWRNVKSERNSYDSLLAVGVMFPERRDTVYSRRLSRVQLYTADGATENVRLDGAVNPEPYQRVMLTDKSFAGGTHTTTVSISSDGLIAPFDVDSRRVRLQIKSVTKEYFDFLMRYERTQPDASAEPGANQGNVTGGYGAVGGAARVEWVFDRW